MHPRLKHSTGPLIGLLLGGLLGLAACGADASSGDAAEQAAPATRPAAGAEATGDIQTSELGTQMAAIDVSMPTEPAARDGFFAEPPPQVLVDGRIYYAVIRTGRGDIVVQLFADRTPITVNNFVYLSLTGYYDGTVFHRVLEDFMAQAGDPTGTGRGGPGYRFQDEFVGNLAFDRPYLLAMANAGPATNGSQFFITFVPTPHLNQRHTIFGEVVAGQAAVDGITRRDPQTGGPADVLDAIEVYEGGDSILAAPAPTPTPTPVPTPYAPHQLMAEEARPLAALAPADRKNLFNAPPDPVLERNQPYGATLEFNYGSVTLELFPERAFDAVNNFAVLADVGFFDNVPVLYSAQSRSLLLGALDGTRDGMVGYTLPLADGHVADAPRAGMLLYLPDFDDPARVQGGALFLVLEEMSPEIMSEFLVVGGLTEGWDTLIQLVENSDAILERVEVFAGDAGPVAPRPTPPGEEPRATDS